MNSHFILSLIIVIAITVHHIYGQRDDCKTSFETADGCMRKILLLGDPEYKFPTTKEEMDRQCSLIPNIEKCIKDYSIKCLDTFARQVTNVLVFGAVKTNNGYCSNNSRKDEFIAIGECANSRKQSMDRVMDEFIDTLQGINYAEQTHTKVPLICCNFNKFKATLLDVARDERPYRCSEPVVAELDKLVEGFANEVLNLICPKEYIEEGGDKCDQLLPQTPMKKSNELRPKSMLMPLVNIFNSLKNKN